MAALTLAAKRRDLKIRFVGIVSRVVPSRLKCVMTDVVRERGGEGEGEGDVVEYWGRVAFSML